MPPVCENSFAINTQNPFQGINPFFVHYACMIQCNMSDKLTKLWIQIHSAPADPLIVILRRNNTDLHVSWCIFDYYPVTLIYSSLITYQDQILSNAYVYLQLSFYWVAYQMWAVQEVHYPAWESSLNSLLMAKISHFAVLGVVPFIWQVIRPKENMKNSHFI